MEASPAPCSDLLNSGSPVIASGRVNEATPGANARRFRSARRFVAVVGARAQDGVHLTPYIDTYIPPNANRAICPSQILINLFASYVDMSGGEPGGEYFFSYRVGTYTGMPFQQTNVKYVFSDSNSLPNRDNPRRASLTNKAVIGNCWRTIDADGNLFYYLQPLEILGDFKLEPAPPNMLAVVQHTETDGTAETWCFFRNYYDNNWNYEYSEIIPGSCWTIWTT